MGLQVPYLMGMILGVAWWGLVIWVIRLVHRINK